MRTIDRFRMPACLLVALLLASACGPRTPPTPDSPAPASPTSATPTPTSAAAAATSVAPSPTSAVPAPTSLAPNPTSVAPAPTSLAPNPTSVAQQANLIPADVPWVLHAGVIYGDDESFALESHGLPAPSYQIKASPGGAYVGYIALDGGLTVADMRSGQRALPTAEPIADVWGFAFAPDGQTIAYNVVANTSWGLYVADLASGKRRTLFEASFDLNGSDVPALYNPVAWTRDGLIVEQVAGVGEGQPFNLLLIDPANGNARALRTGQHLAAYPAPGGGRIAVVTGVRPIGEQPSAAVSVIEIAGGPERTLLPEAPMDIRALRWSPNGSTLLIATAIFYGDQRTELHAIRADGTHAQRMTVGSGQSKAEYTDIAWHNNDYALLLSAEAGRYLQVYTLPIAQFELSGLSLLMGIEKRGDDQAISAFVYWPG